jgi:hypothetical protein
MNKGRVMAFRLLVAFLLLLAETNEQRQVA